MSLFEDATEQSQHAAEYGFDWDSKLSVMLKVLEETQELQVAVNEEDLEGIRHEMGDVLLALVSLARHSDISMEQAFYDAIQRFQGRWNEMTQLAKEQNIQLVDQSPAEWESLWENAKAELDRRA